MLYNIKFQRSKAIKCLIKLSSLFILIILISHILYTNVYAKKSLLKGFKVTHFPFYIYHDAEYKLNHFYLGTMRGDFFHIKINHTHDNNPKKGKTCIKLQYNPRKKPGYGWAQISFQPAPSNYWNDKRGSYDLTTAKKLFFFARGENGDETITFKMVGLNGKDTGNKKLSTGEITLSKDWKLYAIDLSNSVLPEIAGGLAVLFAEQKESTSTIYIDEIQYSDKPQIIQ